jgi:antitoxin component YwqK of YwqJK toxin-antitoxin module
MIEYTVTVKADGTTRWHLNGKLHREDGPAVKYANGTKFWYINGKLHREDGPAVEYANGGKVWFLNGESLSKEEFKAHTSKEVIIDGKTYVLSLK